MTSLLLGFVLGCNTTAIRENQDDLSASETEDTASEIWDDAELVIISPASGEWLELDQDYDFEAELISADGEALDFDEVAWSSDIDDGWEGEGLSFESDGLDAGLHAITAQVRLPNGDRLSYTAGGVRVQSPYSGTYAGTLIVDADYSGTIISCSGSAVMVVDDQGELAEGDASCVLSISGYDLDLEYTFDLEVDRGDLTGDANAVILTWEVPLPYEGEVDEDGALTGTFSGGVGSLELTGELDLERVSRETE